MKSAVGMVAAFLILWSLASLALGLWWLANGWGHPRSKEKGLWAQWETMKANGVADADQLTRMFPDMAGYKYTARISPHYDTPLHALFGPYIEESSAADKSGGVALVANGVVLLAAGLALRHQATPPKPVTGTTA